MPDSDPELLIQRHLDGDLDEAGRQDLALLLRDSAKFRGTYLRTVQLAEFLPEALGKKQVPPRRRRPRALVLLATLGAAAVLILALLPRTSPESVPAMMRARISSLSGSLIIDGKPAVANAFLSPGQTLLLEGNNPHLAFAYPDGTKILLLGPSQLSLADQGGKNLTLRRGSLHAEVAKQRSGKPLTITTLDSTLEILGTRFSVGAEEENTRLVVSKGLVRYTNNERSQEVASGQAVSSGEDKMEYQTLESWADDFEEGGGDGFFGKLVQEDLPAGSRFAVEDREYFLESLGRQYRMIAFRDLTGGLFKTAATSHLTFVCDTKTANWFNVFFHAVEHRVDGSFEIQMYKLDPKLIRDAWRTPGDWHRVEVPLSAFREQAGGDYDGPPPGPDLLVTTFYWSSPHEDVGLRIDGFEIQPAGNDSIQFTPLQEQR